MATNRGVNISSYLRGNNTQKSNQVKSSNTGLFAMSPFGTNTGSSSMNTNTGNWKTLLMRIISYLFAILIVVFVILLFIHYFVIPVFRLKPGSPGIIPVPGWDDGVLFWKQGNTGPLLNKDLPISNQYFGYSIHLDLFIQNPMQFSNYPRVLFSRGATLKETPSGETLLGVLDNYNLAVALLPDTNDLIVSVLNKDNQMENAIIPNIPVQEPFRLTMIVMEKALEVYINGHLMKTRAFYSPPKDVKGDIYPSSGREANIAKLRNLKIWSRVLTIPEIRDTTPPLSTAKEMGGGAIPSSSSCSVKPPSTK
jgi:hypothetical protein